ncbi:acetylxylan esterase [Microbacterium sp. 179-I 3D4 NHS]|uniref:acetylxylan esterase n=1 Tax=Microbacterium sp. 179-I 3D4 NHS TaxID=3142381 RepID=UPI0039A0D902
MTRHEVLPNPSRGPVAVERPDDFDEFWRDSLTYLDRTPAAATYTRDEILSGDGVDVYDVRYDSAGGVRVAAWLTVPEGAEQVASLPGILLIPGYISDPTVAKSWSLRGYAVMSVAPRGKVRALDHVNPGYPGLLVDGVTDPYSATYRSFYLDVVRGLDLLEQLDVVDAARIGVHGSSQGGGLAVMLGALRPDSVACLSAGAPYLCGIMDSARLTLTYPYQEIREYLSVHPERFAAVDRTYAYLDVLNLADRVVCPAQVYIGMGDDVCPPETAYELVDRIPGDVEFLTYDGCAHGAGLPWVSAEIDAFLDAHLHPSAVAQREHDQIGSNA